MIRITAKQRLFVASSSLLAASLFSGCQSAGTQLVSPMASRGDAMNVPTGTVPTSPAFAQVAAGQTPGMVQRGSAQPQPYGSPGMPQQGIVGSGGVVYPVAYTPQMAGQVPMPMVAPPVAMPGNPAPVTLAPMNINPTPTPGATPVVSIVLGPNGPQYVISEVFNQPTSVVPAMPAPAGPAMLAPAMPMPQPIAPTTPVASTVIAPAAASLPAPATIPSPPQNYTTPAGNPSFNPLPPETISMPALPALAPTSAPTPGGIPAPDVLPPTLNPGKSSGTATGASLPASMLSGPSLGAFPAVPSPTPTPSTPKLPTPSKAIDDDIIPPAPVFVPVGR